MAKRLIPFIKGRGKGETFGGREMLKKIVLVILLVSGIVVAPFLLKHEIPLTPTKQQPPSVESLLRTLPLNSVEQRRLFSFGDELYRKGHYEQARVYYLKILSAVERKRRELVKEPEKTLKRSGEDPRYREKLQKHLGEISAWARWRIAYTYAKQKRWEEAIRTFRELAEQYDGTWEFRHNQPYALPERAFFQIGCCYRGKMREAKDPREREEFRQKAINAFTEVMVQFPDSPISVVAARAIADLNGGKLPDRAGKVYYRVLKRDEERRKRQSLLWAMCGPAALHWLLQHHFPNISLPSIDQIAKMAKTDETGTSLYNLKEAAKKLGVRTSALEVTFEGLKEIRLPALLLLDGHYVVVKGLNKKGIILVNPIPPLVLGVKGKQKDEPKERWQFTENFLLKEQLGEGWRGIVLVVLGRY